MDQVMEYKRVKVPIYEGTLHLHMGGKVKDLFDLYEWDYDELRFEGAYGLFSKYIGDNDKRQYVIWFNDKPKSNVISHEVVHFKNGLFYDIGLKSRYKNDEMESYFVGYFTKIVTKWVKKQKRKRRKSQ